MRNVVLIAAVCCVVIPVYGQKAATKTDKRQQAAADPKPQKNEVIKVDTVNVNKLNVDKQEDSLGKGNQNINRPPPYVRRLFAAENLPNLILCVIGIAGVIAAIYTLGAINRQTDATEKAVEVAQCSINLAGETAQRQLRAYICLDSAAVVFPQPAVPEAQVVFSNCGQTPAYDVRGWIHTWFTAYPLRVTLPEAQDNFRKGSETLAAGRKTTFVAARKPPLPPQQLAALGSPQFTLFVYGRILYKDTFGKDQFTNFRLIHGGNEGTRSRRDKNGVEQWLLKPDEEGNDAS